MDRRPRLHSALFIVCVTAVAWASFLTPRVGKCGSALYFLTRVVAGLTLLASGIASIQTQAIGLGVAAFLSVVVFGVPALVWYRKAPRSWYVAGVLTWTGLYLVSYFFLLPTSDCP